jgi:hypothetical protein
VLFDQVERTDTRLKRENESTFLYLNSSARSPMTAAREVLEQWFATYPDSGRVASGLGLNLCCPFRTERSLSVLQL